MNTNDRMYQLSLDRIFKKLPTIRDFNKVDLEFLTNLFSCDHSNDKHYSASRRFTKFRSIANQQSPYYSVEAHATKKVGNYLEASIFFTCFGDSQVEAIGVKVFIGNFSVATSLKELELKEAKYFTIAKAKQVSESELASDINLF